MNTMANKLIQRRGLLTLAGATGVLLSAGPRAWAQTTGAAQQQLKPYLEVKPVPGEGQIIRGYYAGTCNHSRQYFNFLKNLSASLPSAKKFIYTPYVNSVDGLAYAASWACVQRFSPPHVNNFVEASLLGIQDRGLDTKKVGDLETIARAAHVPFGLREMVIKNEGVLKADVQNLIRVQKGLNITNTPSVAVAGTFIVNPELTMGDAAMFSQLVNAVISMVL
jgi:protein dithiol oxidoreductase (disulfide-forming)